MESELKEYKTAVSELIAHNPKLYEYFSKKIKFSDEEKNSFKRNFSLKGSTTVKN